MIWVAPSSARPPAWTLAPVARLTATQLAAPDSTPDTTLAKPLSDRPAHRLSTPIGGSRAA